MSCKPIQPGYSYLKPRNENYETMRHAALRIIQECEDKGVSPIPWTIMSDEACEFLKCEPGHAFYDEWLDTATEYMEGIIDDIIQNMDNEPVS
jgi:hypothetical protein